MKKLILYSFACLSLAALLSACSAKGGNSSSKTGVPYADRKSKNNQSGAFAVATRYKRAPGPGLIPIEGGVLVVGGSAIEVPGIEPNIYNYKRQVTVPSFYMDETEVSNTDWLEYLHWIRYNYPEDQEFYYNELPDTLVWRSALSYNEPYVDNYLRHPAYRDYPVVGVSWEQASRYCQWRTSRANEFILREKGILTDYKTLAGGNTGKNNNAAATTAARPDKPFNTDAYLNGQYDDKGKNAPIDYNTKSGAATGTAGATAGGKGNNQPRRTATLEDGVIMQPYRLPTEAEWEYAALGLIGNTEYENINQNKIYPWNGLGVSSASKKTRGLIQANFKRAPGDYMGVGGSLNDKGDLTVPVIQYTPNDFGLYNMAGNVNEWVNDVYRTGTFTDADAFNPYRGNYFENKKLDNAQTGKIALDKYGNPIKENAYSGRKQTWAEKQAQAKRADSISKSTDPQSTVASNTYQADQRGYRDAQKLNLNEEGVTLINDKSRVYKGGSWNDMAYWLNPATRRFLSQDESSAEIGFRCAMTMLGAPEISTSGKRSFKTPAAKPYRVSKGK